jgi:APA family basic amino acid/polyamine antiporter
MQNLLGHSAELIMAGIVVISTFGCNNGIILSGARVYYAMSKDGLFFKKVGVLNKKGVPSVGLWIQAVWCTVLCLSGSYGQLLDYIVLAVLVFFVLTILAVFIMRKKRPDAERPVRAIGYPVLPAIYIIFCIAIEIIILINKPQYTWPALIILLSGVPVYYIWRKFGSRE